MKNLAQGVETFSEGAMMAHPGVKEFLRSRKSKECTATSFRVVSKSTTTTGGNAKEKKKINLNPAIENFQMTVGNYIDQATGSVNWKPGMGCKLSFYGRKIYRVGHCRKAGSTKRAFESLGLPSC